MCYIGIVQYCLFSSVWLRFQLIVNCKPFLCSVLILTIYIYKFGFTKAVAVCNSINACFRGLAKNCNAPINTKTGAESKDWKAGKPVRVVRNCKLAKHSKYAPEEGNRYDGIYKVRNVTLVCWLG